MYIVIVSTNKPISKVIKEGLILKGHKVATFNNAYDGFINIKKEKPHLCIIDTELDSKHTGPELVSNIRDVYQYRINVVYMVKGVPSAAVYIDGIKTFTEPLNLNDLYKHINGLIN